MEKSIVVFQEKEVRRVWHEEDWWYAVEDVVAVLTDSNDPKQYIRRIRSRDSQLAEGWVQIVRTLSVPTAGGSQRMNCSNLKGIFRLIMSIPSPKAEPFKLWLAQVGQERVAEIDNPELGFERVRAIYQAKGYPEEWIERRLQSIEVRKQLTDEWKNRGVQEGREYSILTAEIARATFGLNPAEHKNLKNLSKPTQNLRDHMTPLELIFTALGEEMTRKLAVEDDAQGFPENSKAARKGGRAAGDARLAVEKRTGLKVVSSENYLGLAGGPASKQELSEPE